jgi:hypothetical protein
LLSLTWRARVAEDGSMRTTTSVTGGPPSRRQKGKKQEWKKSRRLVF